MSWEGYFEYAGSEVINVARTEAYARNMGATWFRPVFNNTSLPTLLGDGEYKTPLLDDAPWTDPDIEESYDFYGVYPLGIEGLENSTRSSTVVESTNDGGIAGRLRHATKAVVFNCVMVAGSDAGADYGMAWLRRILLGGPCGPDPASACFGETLCYLASEPEIDASTDAQDCWDYHLRSLRQVVINNGPSVTAKRQTKDGGAAWSVTFTAVAGHPFEYGSEVPVIEGFLDPEVLLPWAGGLEPDGASLDTEGHAVDEDDCSVPAYAPIQDPEHPAIVAPPLPPSVPIGNFTPPDSWHRRQFTVPKQYVPLWGEVVPKVQIHARDSDVRNVRLRFYADPYKIGDISDDPCAYCGDIIVSYVPQDHSLIFDASEQQVYVTTTGGARQRADTLVFKSDGTPFDWPTLSCGFGYVVTIDMPKQQTPPVIDLSLFARAM